MISVVRLLEQQLLSGHLTGYTLGYGNTTPHPWLWKAGGILFVFSGDGTKPKSHTSEIPFGWKKQGTRVWGALRDKDVLHLNAKGSVVLGSSLDALAVPEVDTIVDAYGTAIECHVPSLAHGGLTLPIACVVPWGTDVTFTDTVVTPWRPRTDTTWWNPTYQSVKYTIKFDNLFDTALVLIEPAAFIESYGGAHSGSEIKTHISYAQWLWRNPEAHGDGLWASQRYTTAMGDGSSQYITTQNGRHRLETLDATPARWNIRPVSNIPLEEGIGGIHETGGSVVAERIVYDALTSVPWRDTVFRTLNEPELPENWGVLGQQIVEQCDYTDVNNLLLGLDFALLSGEISQWRKFAFLLRDVHRWLRTGGQRLSKYLLRTLKSTGVGGPLLQRFGVNLTAQDILRNANAVIRLLRLAGETRRLHTRYSLNSEQLFLGSPVEIKMALNAELGRLPLGLFVHLVILGYQLQGIPLPPALANRQDGNFLETAASDIEQLRRMGLYPTFETLWDLIPCSFVIDGAVDVGQLFERMDVITRAEEEYFPLHYSIRSTKRSWTVPISNHLPALPGVSGNVIYSYYDRYTSPSLPLPPLEVGEGTGDVGNIVEAILLVVQRS